MKSWAVAQALIIYQSHHLWNWNFTDMIGFSDDLSPINRTIFGIETKTAKPALCCSCLSIAPSLELKQRGSYVYVSRQVIYQSHHLWNWNIKIHSTRLIVTALSIAPSLELKLPKRVTAQSVVEGLSIAPSLELKLAWPRFGAVILIDTINRTIFGIETL